jgi:hypothetical protein
MKINPVLTCYIQSLSVTAVVLDQLKKCFCHEVWSRVKERKKRSDNMGEIQSFFLR